GVEEFPPAGGRGAIAIATRLDDARVRGMVAAIVDAGTGHALAAERAFLAVLDGSCRTPIAGHAVAAEDSIAFHGLVLRPDGSQALEARRRGAVADPAALGADAGS